MLISRKHLVLMIAASALLAFTACEDDDNNNNTTNEIPQMYQDLPGTLISQNTTWSGNVDAAGKYYVLPGVTLTIAAGTTVSFAYHEDNPDDVGAIITLRGDSDNFSSERASGRLVANGTAAQPIVFTSARATKSPGDWGGIVLIGEAPNNIPGGTGDVEGLAETVHYGGSKSADDSGVLKYVRIEYCGYGIAADSELNGLSLYSVGSATTLDHIQVYKCTDDGYEWFGGTVNARYLLSTFNDDDSFDMDEGWRGKGQFWLAVQHAGSDNGFESDGRKTLGSGLASHPTLSNVTLYGFGAGKDAEDKNYGMRLREDFEGELSNFVISNFAGLNWKLESNDGDVTSANFDSGILSINRACVYSNNLDGSGDFGGFASQADSTRFCAGAHNVHVLDNAVFPSAASHDYRPAAGSSAASGGQVPSDSWFDAAGYMGAVAPSGSNWTTESWVRWAD
ncbi:MAG: hypothetical protein KC518_03545 [Candidatus Cloacimonetes bacterium]|nr:hypothetical protein [Candidatus Cloacimonadota bacterium]